MTNRHVIAGASRITLRVTDGRILPAILVAYSDSFDAAVLKIEGNDLPILPLGDSDAARQGQEVLVFGFPRPDVLGVTTITVTRGIISAVRQSEGLLQVDAALNPGNSGGPVVNAGYSDMRGRRYVRIDGKWYSNSSLYSRFKNDNYHTLPPGVHVEEVRRDATKEKRWVWVLDRMAEPFLSDLR